MKFEFLLKNFQIPLFARQEQKKILLNSDKTIRKNGRKNINLKILLMILLIF